MFKEIKKSIILQTILILIRVALNWTPFAPNWAYPVMEIYYTMKLYGNEKKIIHDFFFFTLWHFIDQMFRGKIPGCA